MPAAAAARPQAAQHSPAALAADSPIGILAGGGALPAEIAATIERRGGRVQVVSLAGEADAAFEGRPHVRVAWGEVGRIMTTLKVAGVRDLVIVGAVTRPDLWRLRPDLGLVVRLPAILKLITAGGDDGVLRRVVRVFEREGFQVLGPDQVAPELVGRAGPIAGPEASTGNKSDAGIGFEVVAALGPYDVGQAVVVAGGRVIAIEGAEGTDRLLRRLADRRDTHGGVLIKRPKPNQELRIDLPAIGPETVTRAAAVGLAAIVVEADRVIIAGRAEMSARADTAAIAVLGIAADAMAAAVQASGGPATPALVVPPRPWLPWSRAAARRQMLLDAERGGQVASCLARFQCGHAIVVSRRHVLAVGAAEATADVLARVATLRQWGDGRTRARRGVLVCRLHAVASDTIAAAAAAGLAGIHVVDADTRAVARLTADAERCGLELIAPAQGMSRG